MATKAIKITDSITTYLPMTNSDLVQYGNYPQSVTAYVDNIKASIENISGGSDYSIIYANNSTNTTLPTQSLSDSVYLNLVNTTQNHVQSSIYLHANNGLTLSTTGISTIDIGIGQDHSGDAGSADNVGTLAYWNSVNTHAAYTNTVGNNQLPIYLDEGKPKTILPSALTKVYQYNQDTTNYKYPLLTKYSSGGSSTTAGSVRTTSTSTNNMNAYYNPYGSYIYSKYTYSDDITEGGQRLVDKYALKGEGGGQSSIDYITVNNNMNAITIFNV